MNSLCTGTQKVLKKRKRESKLLAQKRKAIRSMLRRQGYLIATFCHICKLTSNNLTFSMHVTHFLEMNTYSCVWLTINSEKFSTNLQTCFYKAYYLYELLVFNVHLSWLILNLKVRFFHTRTTFIHISKGKSLFLNFVFYLVCVHVILGIEAHSLAHGRQVLYWATSLVHIYFLQCIQKRKSLIWWRK
jgi:hypothetical protein